MSLAAGKNSAEPAVSVVIPTYNQAAYVREAVDSALSQQDVRVELIVVDDGSTDDTAELLASYGDRIVFVRQSNQGTAAARNRGMQLATAEYVAFQDADDYFLPGALTRLAAVLESRADLGAVQGGLMFVDRNGRELRVDEPWRDAPVFDLETCVFNKPVYLQAMLVRKSWVERVGGFDGAHPVSADVDFLIRLVAEGCAVEWVRSPLACYRRHDENMTCDAVPEAQDLEAVLDKYFARPDVPARLRRREPTIRFYTSAWSAWRMSTTGQAGEIATWLRRSLQHTPYSDEETVLAWLRLFAEHDALAGRTVVGAPVWLPAVEEVARNLRLARLESSAVLEFWARVWAGYLADPNAGNAEALSAYRDGGGRDLTAVVKESLLLSPPEQSVAILDRFWLDVAVMGGVPSPSASAVAGSYLTAFGLALFSRNYAVARVALGRAVRSSRRPGAVAAWYRFSRNACSYLGRRLSRGHRCVSV
jgi:glycosyltransferase involved in cell wall biosynthesis